jgi:uncharacterized protein (UPF0276 family)
MRSPRENAAASRAGVGLVWWPELDPLCRPGEGLVHVIEAEPETFWVPRDMKSSGFMSRLPATLEHLPQPKLLHGVGAPFGGSARQTASHCEALAGDIAALQPAWISDHLSFNQFILSGASGTDQVVSTGFFLPPAQCQRGVEIAAEQIRRRRLTTGVPVAFEVPVSYLPRRPGEMPDGAFAAEVAEAADCGILLDLHNLLCNERNGRQSVAEFCKSIPLERVWEVHLAGGEAAGGYWVDAHSGLVEPALMEIVASIVPQLPALRAIIFEIIPDYVASVGLAPIGKMLGELNELWLTHTSNGCHAPGRSAPVRNTAPADRVTPGMWEMALGAAVTEIAIPELPGEFADWVRSAEIPLGLYRTYSRETRASSLVDTAPRTIRTLLRHQGETRTRALLADFWRQATPAYSIIEDAWTFLDFVCGADLTIQGLDEDTASDRAFLLQTIRSA